MYLIQTGVSTAYSRIDYEQFLLLLRDSEAPDHVLADSLPSEPRERARKLPPARGRDAVGSWLKLGSLALLSLSKKTMDC